MHKRNITLTALALAAVVTLAFQFSSTVTHSDILGGFYIPAIFMSVVLSGGSHSPSEVAAWSSFIVYTLFYWSAFLVAYAFLWEIYLFRSILRHLEDARRSRPRSVTADSRGDLERLVEDDGLSILGKAIKETESRRRSHFLLNNTEALDLSATPEHLAAQAITHLANARPVKGLVKKLEAELAAEAGPQKAAELMAKLRVDATRQATGSSDGLASP